MYRILLVSGACIFLLALPMPTHQPRYTSGDGFAAGLFSGMTYGYEAFLYSFLMIIFPPFGLLYGSAAFGGLMQVVLAMRTLLGKTPRKFWRTYFLITGIAFPILMLCEIGPLKVGYVVFQSGYWITTIALWGIYRASKVLSSEEISPSLLRE
jgi:hypothetical protein